MNSSRPQPLPKQASLSSANSQPDFSDAFTSFAPDSGLPGSYDDTSVIRGILIDAMRRSGLSRAAIADRMSYLLARSVTEAMLNAFTAESRGDRRWPAEFDRAFCEATGDMTLLRRRVEMAGMHVIDAEQMDLLELGRAFLQRSQAEAKIAALQTKLSGRSA